MSIGRPKAFDPEQVLDRAMHVFWAQGYKNTSLQDLLDATCLSKSSLYHAYGSKQQLFESAVEHYYRVFEEKMRLRLDEHKTGLGFIEDFLNDTVREAEGSASRYGCFLVNTANECAQSDINIARAVSKGFGRFKALLREAVERGVADGSICGDVDGAVAAHYLVSSMAGLRTMAKGGAQPRELRNIIAVVLSSLTT